MGREIYPAASGASATWRQLEVVANNLANSGTVGFKAQRTAFEADRGDGATGELAERFVRADVDNFDMGDGPIRVDGDDAHLALRGRGFFQVESADGTVLLTRSGALRVDPDGHLVTEGGDFLLGEGGRIVLPEGERLQVSPDGTLRTAKGDEIDRIAIVEAEGAEPVGGSRWRATGGVREASGATVVQGALEGSNADPLRGMVELVEAGRYFEIYQKAMTTADELDGRIIETARSS